MYIKQQLWNIPCEFYYGLKMQGEFFFLMQQNHSYLNSLRPSNAIWHWWSWSTLVKLHVMACCLMVSSHYLNQYWLITTEVLRWYTPGCSFTGNVEDNSLPLICIWKLLIKITAAYSRWRWVNCFMLIGSLHMRFSGPPIVDYSLFIKIHSIGASALRGVNMLY